MAKVDYDSPGRRFHGVPKASMWDKGSANTAGVVQKKLAKVQFKCWRYVLTDHASGLVLPWYVEAAGESPLNLYRFLMHAWADTPGRRFHGVPKASMWDKGSANTAGVVQNLLRALEVQIVTHAPCKGSVEDGHKSAQPELDLN